MFLRSDLHCVKGEFVSEAASKSRFRIRALMAVIALVAIGLWAYIIVWPPTREWWKNRHVWSALETPVPMPFAKGVPLGAVVKHVKMSTVSPQSPNGVPIYIEPADLTSAGQTMGSTVTIDRANEPLVTSLKDALSPLGLTYRVEGGLLKIVKLTK
jgi:hypothetical protein